MNLSSRRHRMICSPYYTVDSFDSFAILRSRNRLMAKRTADRKLRAILSLRVAPLRNSLILPKKRSMRLRFPYARDQGTVVTSGWISTE